MDEMPEVEQFVEGTHALLAILRARSSLPAGDAVVMVHTLMLLMTELSRWEFDDIGEYAKQGAFYEP